ncbi:MAG: hypothetical protein OXG35_15050, partial [Acidobacteria bacterium]|nr:hypothetical protein [Acidobacteriota bacterium]
TGMPTGYRESEMDPRVSRSTPIVTTGPELIQLLRNWQRTQAHYRPAAARRDRDVSSDGARPMDRPARTMLNDGQGRSAARATCVARRGPGWTSCFAVLPKAPADEVAGRRSMNLEAWL